MMTDPRAPSALPQASCSDTSAVQAIVKHLRDTGALHAFAHHGAMTDRQQTLLEEMELAGSYVGEGSAAGSGTNSKEAYW